VFSRLSAQTPLLGPPSLPSVVLLFAHSGFNMATLHSQPPFQSSSSAQSHPFSTSSTSPFQLRPVSPHYPQLPPHPQPSPERRSKTEIEREKAAFNRNDREHVRVDVSMRDDRGYGERFDKGALREPNLREGRTEHFPRDAKEQLRERADWERRDVYPRDGRAEERDRETRRPLSPSSLRGEA